MQNRLWLLPLAAVLVAGGLWLVFRGLPSEPELTRESQPVADSDRPEPPPGHEVDSVPSPAVPEVPRPQQDPEPAGGEVEEQFERAALPATTLTEAVAVGARERPRRVYVDTRVLVELDAREGSKRTGQPPVAGARLVSESGVQRRWVLPADTDALTAHAALDPEVAAGHSLVVHGAPSSTSPGQVPVALLRVKFPPAWAPREVARFAELHDLEGQQKLTIEPNWYSFRTASGPAALARAQALRTHEDVLAAEPDWWRPLRVR